MRILISLLIILVPFIHYGQQRIVKCTITSVKGNPVASAKVRPGPSDKLLYSDREGNLHFPYKNEYRTLTVSHVSYFGQEIKLDPTVLRFENDTATIRIALLPKDNLLDSVVIHSEKIQPVYTTINNNVIDYDFFGDKILLLSKEKMIFKIKTITRQGKLLKEQRLLFKPLSLDTDCEGNMYVLSKDSAYWVNLVSTTVTLTPYPKNRITSFLSSCAAASTHYLFVRHYTDYNKRVVYSRFDKKDRSQEIIHEIKDETAIALAKNYDDSIANNNAPQTIQANVNNIGRARDKLEDMMWLEGILTQKAYHPLIQFGETLYLFDHLTATCFKYSDKGEALGSVQLDYPSSANWQKLLLPDYEKEAVYAVTRNAGVISLLKINLTTGKTDQTFLLEEHDFPKNLKVHKGYVYYLYNTSSGFYKLYRQFMG